MRIVFIITSTGVGGAEVSLRKLARYFEPTAVMIVSLQAIGVVGLQMRDDGYEVISLNMRAGRLDLSALWRLVRIIRRFKPDVVSTWLYHADILGGFAARLAGVRAVVWGIRASDVGSDKVKRLTRRLIKLCAHMSHHIPLLIASNSHCARAAHVAIGYDASRFRVIANGFDTTVFAPDPAAYAALRAQLGVAQTTPLVGMVGRFDPVKNHEGFIAAAALVHRSRADVHFVLVGDGMDRGNERLMTWINIAGLGRYVHLLGLRHDVAAIAAGFDVATLTSWSESCPSVVGEAMACAVPCVVTDVGDARLIVGDTGIVVPVGDMVALAGGVLDLLNKTPQARTSLGEGARRRIVEQFGLERVGPAYRDCFAAAAQGRATKGHRSA